jgi:histidinol dehydrogenase
MRVIEARDSSALARLTTVDRARSPRIRREAARIVKDVLAHGDIALNAWRRRLDGPSGRLPVEVSKRELRRGCNATPQTIRAAIREAIRNVERVATAQSPRPFAMTVRPGVRIEQRVEPISRVACYVPGGRYPLPSTAIMTVVPARVAGVSEIVVCCPSPAPAVIFAAVEAGATRVFRMGGAHAIAALAGGTATIPRMDKIVGPGNAWVTAAKDLVAFEGLCTIDMHAGPSEIVVLSDEAPAPWIAADLIAQAEHDPSARAIFVTTQQRLATDVLNAIRTALPKTGPARLALRDHGAIVIARNISEAHDVVRRIAPEHLVCDRQADADACVAAGTVFVGRWSAQAAGDYATGSNHVLPTGGAARTRGGLHVADFLRVYSVQRATRRGLARLAPSITALAEAEGLIGHAASIRVRVGGLS